MAYVLTHFWPGGTEQECDVTVRAAVKAAGGQLPELFHAHGPTDGGILIVTVYESKAVADRFLQETLMPLMPIDGGLVGPPEERATEAVVLTGLEP
jgi:hypothetical protein